MELARTCYLPKPRSTPRLRCVVGSVLLVAMVVFTFVMKAKQDAPAPIQAQGICLGGYSSRLCGLVVSAAIALVALVLAIVSDIYTCDFGKRINLLSAAFSIHLIGGTAMYSLSSCGCSLCICYCSCETAARNQALASKILCCPRLIQATTAHGFSLNFRLFGSAATSTSS